MRTLVIILGAKYLIAVPILIGVLFLWSASKRIRLQFLIVGVISFVLAYGIAKIAGHFYFNPRPFVVGHFTPLVPHIADNGFPSEHTLLASAIAGIITMFNWRLGAVLWVLALLIGIARVLAGVHHPIDVVASLIIAGGSTLVVYRALHKRLYV